MSDILEWSTPPETQKGKWQRAAAKLKERPGEWALVAEGYSPKTAQQSVAKLLRTYGCEVTTRAIGPSGTCSVWARWPEEEEV